MTNPRTTRTLPALLALGLVTIVALPAATALNLASAGTATADAAWTQTASLGGGTCPPDRACTAQVRETAALIQEGKVSGKASYALEAETHEDMLLREAADAAARVRAEAQAKADAAMEMRERVRADVRAEPDVRTEARGEAAWDSRAEAEGDLGVDGILTLGTSKQVDLREEHEAKAKLEAKAKAQVEATTGMAEQILADLQGRITMTFDAAASAVAEAGAAIGGALGLVQSTNVNVHHELDANVGLGAVPSVDVPDLPSPSLNGSASVVAQAQAAASGIVRS